MKTEDPGDAADLNFIIAVSRLIALASGASMLTVSKPI